MYVYTQTHIFIYGIVKDLSSIGDFVLLHEVYWEAEVLKAEWQIGIEMFSALQRLLLVVSMGNVYSTFKFTDTMLYRL